MLTARVCVSLNMKWTLPEPRMMESFFNPNPPQVWVWSKAKFVNRKFLMEEVYQQHLLEKTKVGPCQRILSLDQAFMVL